MQRVGRGWHITEVGSQQLIVSASQDFPGRRAMQLLWGYSESLDLGIDI